MMEDLSILSYPIFQHL